MNYQIKSLLIATLSLLSYAAEASLIDRHNDDLNISWSQDDHFAQTADVEIDASQNWTGVNEWGEELTPGEFNDGQFSGLASGEQDHFSNSELHYQEVHGDHIEKIKDHNHLSSVPAPTAALLFASGLLGVLAFRSRKRGL